MSKEALIDLARETIKTATNEDSPIEIGVVNGTDSKFHKMPLQSK